MRRKHIRVVIASAYLNEVRHVLDTQLQPQRVGWELLGEPRSVDGIYHLLDRQPHLVIADPPAQLLGPMTGDLLAETLQRGGIPYTLAAEFLTRPAPWLEQALVTRGAIEALPPRAAAFIAYAGGVGKTTITLDTAVAFAARTRLPVLAVEFCHGASAFRTFCDPDLPDLYDCAAEGQAPGTWRGVTVMPMNAQHVVDLPADQVQRFLTAQASRHTLTLVDVSGYPHFLLDTDPLPIQQWWIVAHGSRPDTLDNAAYLAQQRPAAQIVVNQAGRWNLNTWGLPHAARLPSVRRADRCGGQLGAAMLRHIYPGWR